jgi:NAD-dependent dihydropyrimidine dehydrogenase PreA subunit
MQSRLKKEDSVMAGKTIQTEVAEAFGRTFVKGNIPEINQVRCLGCRNCVSLCKKLGPNVLDIVDGIAKPIRPQNCIGDGACMLACPTKAIFLMSKHDPARPPTAI